MGDTPEIVIENHGKQINVPIFPYIKIISNDFTNESNVFKLPSLFHIPKILFSITL